MANTQRVSPRVASSFAADLGDTNSEISQFIEAFFMDYLLSRVEESEQEQIMDVWFGLDPEDEAKQHEFLNEIEENFQENFQKALEAELATVFTQ